MSKKNIIITIITFLFGVFAGRKIHQTEKYAQAKKAVEELLESTVESITPCELIIVTRYNQDAESTITDFSQYEEKNRVGLIVNKTDANPHEDNLDEDIVVYPQALIYKIGDIWSWKAL